MKVSRFKFFNKEKTTVKKLFLVVAAALMLINTLAVPTVARADGGAGNVGGGSGKPSAIR
jgi:hypothetical protein